MTGHTSTSTVDINASGDRVWRALTEPDLVRQWQYGSDVITDWTVGSPIRYVAEWEGSVLEQWGHVLQFQPPTLIRYSLFAPQPGLEDKPENYFTMTYALEESDGLTRLSVIQEDPRPGAAAPAEDDEAPNPILQALKMVAESRPD